MDITVYYEDTDALGIVYYANYFRYIERARTQLFFNADTRPDDGEGSFVVSDVSGKFMGTAKLGDSLVLQTKLAHIGKASAELEQLVLNNNKTIFAARVKLVHVREGKPKKISPRKLDLLNSLAFDR